MLRTANSLGLAALLAMGGAAWAQTATTTTAGDFDKLSPGNQTIVRALFDTEHVNAEGQFFTLDQIAGMHQNGMGWGEIFHSMQADGLTSARNLGQVVSDFRTQNHFAPAASSEVVVTTGTGASVAAGHGRSDGHGDEGASHSAGAAGNGGGHGAGMTSGTGAANGAQASAAAIHGAGAGLAHGNGK